jgi:hypothetical protein
LNTLSAMASREEEKRKRREERMAAEQQVASAQARRKRIQAAVIALLAIGAVVGVVLAVAGGGGDSGNGPKPTEAGPAVKIPAPKEKDLDKAAKAAGCVLLNPPIEGRSHVTSKVTYKTNPPSSGNHNPEPALDGIYDPGNTPEPEHFVHALEHGRIEVQYKPGTPKAEIAQLETVVSEEFNGKAAYKTLLFQNNTKMPYAVAATAWGHILGCKTFDDGVFDAIRDFRAKWVDQGPEIIPPTN